MRRKGDSRLIAIPVVSPREILLFDGRTVVAQVGELQIVRENETLDVVSPSRFRREYEPTVVSALTLSFADCAAIESYAGLGATRTGDTLIAALDRLASIRVGGVRIDFTPGQLSELTHRAGKRGQTLAQTIQAVVDRVRDEIFHRGG